MIIQNIQSLCKRDHISIGKLEQACGLSNATIRRWEKASPSVANLIKVADFFGVSLDWLVGREFDGGSAA